VHPLAPRWVYRPPDAQATCRATTAARAFCLILSDEGYLLTKPSGRQMR
jgi:hypothetical protein